MTEPTEISFVVRGKVIPKKTGQQIRRNYKTGKPFPTSGDEHKAWRDAAIAQVRPLWARQVGRPWGSRDEAVELRVVFYCAPGQKADWDNLYTSIPDMLEAAGVITNDYWCIQPRKGSDRIRDGSEPRAEITVWRHPGYEWGF